MFQPHNPMAVATAIIEGLAIAKYNETESQWEVDFLRNCGHFPKLTVREVNRTDGTVISKIKEYVIEEGDRISITVSAPRGNTDWKYTTGGNFDRDIITHDAQDLRWMLDIETLHEKKTSRKAGEIETNSLSISNGCFYTSVRTRDSYRIKKIGSSKIEKLGLTGRTFGADFEGSSVKIEVLGKKGFTENLPDRRDSRYEMIFDNTCVGTAQPATAETDFHFYYRLIDEKDGKVEIFPPEGTTASRTLEITSGVSALVDGEDPPPQPPVEPDPEQEPKNPACQAIMEGVAPKL